MNAEILVQNVFNLFIIAIILEAVIMAVFSISVLKKMQESTIANSVKEAVIFIISLFFCYNVRKVNLFYGTGLRLPELVDVLFSALFLARMTMLVQNIFAKLKSDND